MIVVFRKELWDKYVDGIILDDNGFGFWIVLSIIVLNGATIQYIEQYFIVRDYSDDRMNWDDCRFSYIYLRDCFTMWKYLFQVCVEAARIFDNCSTHWYLERYNSLIESVDITKSQKQFIKENATDVYKLIERLFLPDSELKELRHRKVLLFGTGGIGIKVKEKLSSSGIGIDYYVDNNSEKQGHYIDNVEVISPQESFSITNAVYIISAIFNGAVTDIYKQLKAAGVEERRIALINLNEE